MTKMPALVLRDASDLASEAPDGVTSDQLEKFWSELSPQERQHLLQIDKQILVEEARRCLYCSRCTASLVESFTDISMHGKQEGSHRYLQDPSTHRWGCLAATNDGALTVLDCFFEEKSLKELRKVFDFGRSRERERELLYPNACGEGKRGWISQGVASNGKGNVVRETCAFHTAKISCEALVDYWSGLNDESRQSLLQMEEEDFVAKLMYRSKDKSFCPHCRKNFMREFREVKELKRAHKEASCTNWFCTPDTRFRCEVMDTTIRAEWHQSFTDGIRSFCRFEWSVGTGEGKSDIMDFKDVGMDESAVVHGLDLRNRDVCYITLRAWKENGKYREFFVKAYALKGKQCIHRRLMFGDRLVSITTGGSMSDFFEQAEEVEDEEDDKLAERNEKDLEKDGPHPEKHAKDPEDARGLLLSIATVVFKQKVERAFREATARQNAHFTFVGLALKLLEGRVHVACKEIITVKKQNQLLEEEEREKREAEERSEKKKSKQREKKLRQKDQIGGKENINVEAEQLLAVDDSSGTDTLSGTHKHYVAHLGDTGKAGEDVLISPAKSEEPLRNISIGQEKDAENFLHSPLHGTNVNLGTTDDHGFIMIEKSKSSRRKLSSQREFAPDSDLDHWDRKQLFVGHDINPHVDYCQAKFHSGGSTTRPMNEPQRSVKTNVLKFNSQGCGLKLSEKSESLTHISQSLKSEGGFNTGFVKLERNMRAEVLLDNQFGVSSAPFESYTDPRTGICHTLITEQNRWESLDLQRMKPRSTSYVDVVMQPSGLGKRLQNSRCACSASEQCNFHFSGNDVQTVDSFICPHQDFGMPFGKSPSLIFEGCNNDGYEYRDKSPFCVENILTCPATGSASIDNISTCPSDEGSIESSGARATENWCTLDSKDSFHLSESRGIFTVSESHEKTQKEGYLYDLTNDVAVEGQSFKYNHGPKIMSSSPHPLGQLFPAQTSDFPVSPLPFLQSGYLAMSSINHGMLEYQSRLQCMRLDAKTQHVGPSSESFASRSNGKNYNPIGEQNSPPVPPVCTSKPFSFFHFGGPIARTSKIEINDAECIRHLDQVDKISYKAYHSAQEYRLFLRSNRSIFWFCDTPHCWTDREGG